MATREDVYKLVKAYLPGQKLSGKGITLDFLREELLKKTDLTRKVVYGLKEDPSPKESKSKKPVKEEAKSPRGASPKKGSPKKRTPLPRTETSLEEIWDSIEKRWSKKVTPKDFMEEVNKLGELPRLGKFDWDAFWKRLIIEHYSETPLSWEIMRKLIFNEKRDDSFPGTPGQFEKLFDWISKFLLVDQEGHPKDGDYIEEYINEYNDLEDSEIEADNDRDLGRTRFVEDIIYAMEIGNMYHIKTLLGYFEDKTWGDDSTVRIFAFVLSGIKWELEAWKRDNEVPLKKLWALVGSLELLLERFPDPKLVRKAMRYHSVPPSILKEFKNEKINKYYDENRAILEEPEQKRRYRYGQRYY